MSPALGPKKALKEHPVRLRVGGRRGLHLLVSQAPDLGCRHKDDAGTWAWESPGGDFSQM
jgi:hypothetical protein